MLGVSAGDLNTNIAKCVLHIRPKSILEYGCGQGKFSLICNAVQYKAERIDAVQKLFSETDEAKLLSRGYSSVTDQDIYEYIKSGIKNYYDMIVALDVIEHFMFSDAMSIIDYSLYRSDYMLLAWPSNFPIEDENPLETHRTSFSLREIASRFNVIYYANTNYNVDTCISHGLHIAILRGHNNFKVIPALA